MPAVDAQSEALRRAELLAEVDRLSSALNLSTSAACRRAGVDPATHHRWKRAYSTGGLEALEPNYANCGRQPLAVPSEQELATLRRMVMKTNRGELKVSITTAARVFANTDACSDELRHAILKPRASKHTLTKTLRRSLQIDPAVIREHRNPKDNGVRYATSPGHMRMAQDSRGPRRLLAGERQSWDDGSINFMVCVKWPWGGCKVSDKYGVKVGRFQLLAGIDDATNFCPGFGFIIRDLQSYRAVDIMAAMGRVWSVTPPPERVTIERGSWESKRVTDFLGAAEVEINRAYKPNHKLIERWFHSLWTKLSFIEGQIGRYRGEMERENKILTAVQAGRVDPREHFVTLERAMDAIESGVVMLNAEPVESKQYGTWIPQDRWEQDLAANPRQPLEQDLAWMWAPEVKEWTVRTNGLVGGMVPSALGFSLPYHFGHRDLYRFEGHKVRVYFDPSMPERATVALVDKWKDLPAGHILTHDAECVSEAPVMLRMADGYATDFDGAAMARGIDLRKKMLGAIRQEYRAIGVGGKRISRTSFANDGAGRVVEVTEGLPTLGHDGIEPAPPRRAEKPATASRRRAPEPEPDLEEIDRLERQMRDRGEFLHAQ